MGQKSFCHYDVCCCSSSQKTRVATSAQRVHPTRRHRVRGNRVRSTRRIERADVLSHIYMRAAIAYQIRLPRMRKLTDIAKLPRGCGFIDHIKGVLVLCADFTMQGLFSTGMQSDDSDPHTLSVPTGYNYLHLYYIYHM